MALLQLIILSIIVIIMVFVAFSVKLLVGRNKTIDIRGCCSPETNSQCVCSNPNYKQEE